jgi:sec-independent protein translocase protein TatB
MFGMGAGELILILVIALLIFGPKKLPDLAKGIGKALREFRRASTDLQEQLSVDHELGDAVREVQAAATGAPSPAELRAARRAYDVEPPVPAEMPAPTPVAAATPPAESPALDAIKAQAAAAIAHEAAAATADEADEPAAAAPLEATSTKPAAPATPPTPPATPAAKA